MYRRSAICMHIKKIPDIPVVAGAWLGSAEANKASAEPNHAPATTAPSSRPGAELGGVDVNIPKEELPTLSISTVFRACGLCLAFSFLLTDSTCMKTRRVDEHLAHVPVEDPHPGPVQGQRAVLPSEHLSRTQRSVQEEEGRKGGREGGRKEGRKGGVVSLRQGYHISIMAALKGTQYVSGLKDWILSWRSTQKPSVGVWHGPNEIRDESRLPYLPWKYLVWNLRSRPAEGRG
ncbi:hypothetical protein EYF80_046604 [Liparis tanakae]|uniref:Uncharacterized protein n=1 Tax=Liparis tanakae TaxID=230148 RepID=A0A4Z2FQW6_9TELE|nr:hypothetical protein EYF80_046604 [Liparis tanakae]